YRSFAANSKEQRSPWGANFSTPARYLLSLRRCRLNHHLGSAQTRFGSRDSDYHRNTPAIYTPLYLILTCATASTSTSGRATVATDTPLLRPLPISTTNRQHG